MRRFFALLISLTCLSVLSFPAYAQSSPTERTIDIVGAKRIEESTIRSYLGFEGRDVLTRSDLDRGLKNLFSTGLFKDIALKQKGSRLIVEVIENPIINTIVFEGNESLEDDDLSVETRLRPRQIYTRSKVQVDTNRIHQLYKRNGRFSAAIEPKIVRLDQNRVDLIYEIDEGDVTKVRSIRFVGNDSFTDSKLRDVISTKEAAWYRFMSSAERYDPDRKAFDEELLRQFYWSEGYADFDILSSVAELSQDRSGFYMTFTVQEGTRYKVSDVQIESRIDGFDKTHIQLDLPVEAGDWYSAGAVRKSVGQITDTLGDMQYAFVDVSPKLKRDAEAGTLGIVFLIHDAARSFVEHIHITGNVRTLDEVIRREILLVEGDPFNKSKLARSEQNIRNLNFFEKVKMEVRQGSAPDLTIVDVHVEEKSTGEVSLGAGFSTSDGLIGDLSFSERNLLGTGRRVKVAGSLSSNTNRFDISFVEPYFLNRDIAAGVSAFNTETNDEDTRTYTEKRTGGNLFMNYPLSENWRQTLKYRLISTDITGVDPGASRFLREQEGKRTTSAVSQRLAYDVRDSRIAPTQGYNFWLETEVAGLGFDSRHVSGVTGLTYYYPVTDKTVFKVLSEVGAITGYGGRDVEINERFSLGGPTSLRGFERYGIGPRDLIDGDAAAGNLFYRGSVQLTFPLGLPEKYGVKGFVFSDYGSLWDADEDSSQIVNEHALRMSTGVGLSWNSPFGPIGVYYAEPFMDEDYDKIRQFEVNFSSFF